MRLSYDVQTDSLYIHFAEASSVDSDVINDALVVDYGKDGKIVGLDIQHASTQLDLRSFELEELPIKAIA